MSLRLVSRNVTARVPIVFTRAASSGVADKSADPKNTPPPEKPNPQAGHDQWMASMASASEEAVKADRSAAWEDGSGYKGMQDRSKKVAEEMKDSTASLTDGLWRSVGGGK